MTTRAELNARERDEREPAAPHWGRGDAPEARYINGRKVRAAGQIDEYGMYYPIPTSRGRGLLASLCWMCTIAALCLMLYAVVTRGGLLSRPAPLGAADPLPTAVIAPTRPPRQPDAPPPAQDYGVADYNRQQQATAAALPAAPVATDAPPTEPPAADAPAATALPEPGQPGFGQSFQEPACSTMITYLRGSPCYGRAGQAPLPPPGSDAFADSFK